MLVKVGIGSYGIVGACGRADLAVFLSPVTREKKFGSSHGCRSVGWSSFLLARLGSPKYRNPVVKFWDGETGDIRRAFGCRVSTTRLSRSLPSICAHLGCPVAGLRSEPFHVSLPRGGPTTKMAPGLRVRRTRIVSVQTQLEGWKDVYQSGEMRRPGLTGHNEHKAG